MALRISLDAIEALALRQLGAAGADVGQAHPVARSIRRAEQDGVRSHGLIYLPVYVEHLTCGKVDGRAVPKLSRPRPGAVVVDAGQGFAQPAIDLGLSPLADAARACGIAALTVHRSYNCGILGHHAERIAEMGLIGLCFTHAPASVAPVGGRLPVIGTNPFALAVPDGAGGARFVLDQSASVVAKSEVILRARKGEPLPEGWALDADGAPTTDPAVALQGSMLPSGGAKGFGVGLLVEVLASALSGAVSSREASPFSGRAGGPPGTGQCFVAIDPDAFAPGFVGRIAGLADAIQAQDGARLPGARRVAARGRALAKGVMVDDDLATRLQIVGQQGGRNRDDHGTGNAQLHQRGMAGRKDTVANVNPSDLGDVIGHFTQGGTGDVDDAVAAARAAQPLWWAAGIQRRHDALMQIGTELMARAAEIGTLLSREEGKPLAEGKGEVTRAGQFFTWFAAEALRLQGDQAESVRPGVKIEVRREAVGVVAIVTPWNFLVATPAWKIAPALAYGNAVVWKLANLTPASAVALAEIIARAGLPAGTFNLVMGTGRAVGDRLVGHPGVDAVSFTGSVAVGQGIAGRVLGNRAKLQMEMGSKNPMLIMDDCDLDLAVAHAANAAFGGTGQKCTAASRLIVHAGVLDAFTERLVKAAKALRVGHALDEGTQIGPVVSEGQLAANLDWITRGRAERAELLTGGQRLERETAGYFMAPAVFAGTRNDMALNRAEMFAPITSILPVDSYAEALAVANDSALGLTAGIMTRSLARAAHFRANMRAGCVMVNLPTAGTDYHVPFGGRGLSSFGPREQGRYAAEFFTTVKTAYMAAGVPE